MKSISLLKNAFLLVLISIFVLSACTPAAVQPVPTSTPLPTPAPQITPPGDKDLPLIVYSRDGGIAGFCDKVVIFASGKGQATSCKFTGVRELTLTASQLEQITAWQTGLAAFVYDHSDGAVADGMTLHLEFTGNGKATASEADQAALLSLASEIALQASRNR